MKKLLSLLLSLFLLPAALQAEDGVVAVIDMDMLILPGTQYFLEKSIAQAEEDGAKALVVKLDTPGGMLNTSKEMIEAIAASPVPVVIYVGPGAGATATSAGVFITVAGHVAAMAPGTSIGAAHPVAGDGKDIEGDMRKKAEEMTTAMVRSIAEERGKNVEWVELAVKESNSITEKEALEKNVIDFIAPDISDLLKQMKGKKIKLSGKEFTLGDYSALPRVNYEMSFRDEAMNVLANPLVAALLSMGATTGIAIELYNPGAIIPGVIGVICLLLSLVVFQIVPVTQGGLLLLAAGSLLVVAELFVPSGFLGAAGIVALILGAVTLMDETQMPGVEIPYEILIPSAIVLGLLLFAVMRLVVKGQSRKLETGNEGLIGLIGEASQNISNQGKAFVNGETWNAVSRTGLISKGSRIRVLEVQEGMTLLVEEVSDKE